MKKHARQPKVEIDIDKIVEELHDFDEKLKDIDTNLGWVDEPGYEDWLKKSHLLLVDFFDKLVGIAYNLHDTFTTYVDWGIREAVNVDYFDEPEKNENAYLVDKHHRQPEWKSFKIDRSMLMEYEGIAKKARYDLENNSFDDIDGEFEEVDDLISDIKKLRGYCYMLLRDIEDAFDWATEEAKYFDEICTKS